MTRQSRQSFALMSFVLIGAYAWFFSVPILLRAVNTGLSGSFEDGGLRVEKVVRQGPADIAGLREGDRIIRWGGIPIKRWYQWYTEDNGTYLQQHAWQAELVTLDIQREGKAMSLKLDTEKAYSTDSGKAGIFLRFIFVLLSMALSLFMANSKDADSQGFAVAAGLCLAVLAILSGARYTKIFMGPFLASMSSTEYVIVATTSAIAAIFLLSTVTWFILNFPKRRKLGRLVTVAIFGLPAMFLTLLWLLAPGSPSERFSAIYPTQIWVNAVFLILNCVMIVRTYLATTSFIQRTRIRTVGSSVFFLGSFLLVFWVLPKWLWGKSIIINGDWLFLPFMAVPIALIFSIQKHHLFGIPGLVRRRLRTLQNLLERERDHVSRRDERIRVLAQEITLLKEELREHAYTESPPQEELPQSRMQRLLDTNPYLKTVCREQLIGVHSCWLEILEQVVMAARIKRSAYILGESGTGKTDLARAIHQLCPHQSGPYREVSCAQFEHGDPAFALGKFFGIGRDHGLPNVPKEGRPGLLEECNGGTLFLDDVDRLPLNVQDLLLYPLEGKAFEPGIGVGKPKLVDVKFIFASNRDLGAMVVRGHFRGDILARMGTRIHIPPLRDRATDIPPLIRFLLPLICSELEHTIHEVSPRAMQFLCNSSYEEGNVRQLRSELEGAVGKAQLEDDKVLRAKYLSVYMREGRKPHKAVHVKPNPAKVAEVNVPRELEVLREFGFRIKESEQALSLSHKSRTLSNHLRGMCLEALAANSWDLRRAARSLAGTENEEDVERVERKMERFLARIKLNVNEGKEATLFNNLPLNYQPALTAAIDRAHSQANGLRGQST